jgi:putative membrane protein
MNTILETLQVGLPVLLSQLGVTLALLGLGSACYMAVRLIRAGNTAAGVVLAGTLVALAIPLATTLATSLVILDILLWGLVALVIQLLTFVIAAFLIRGLRDMIEAGNIAAAWLLVGIQLSVALLNAGAMAG